MAHLHLDMVGVGLLLYGTLMDMYECFLQEHGLAEPRVKHYIDDIIPLGLGGF